MISSDIASTKRIVKESIEKKSVKIWSLAITLKVVWKHIPKPGKKYVSGEFIFKSDCAYKHVEPTENKEQIKLEEKVEQLEKIVHQEQIKNMENQKNYNKIICLLKY